MKTRPLRGLAVTELGFGGASLGNLYTKTSDEEARLAVDTAWDGGVRYFDTAPHYGLGLSERRLGTALAGRPRDDYILSTKLAAHYNYGRPSWEILVQARTLARICERHGTRLPAAALQFPLRHPAVVSVVAACGPPARRTRPCDCFPSRCPRRRGLSSPGPAMTGPKKTGESPAATFGSDGRAVPERRIRSCLRDGPFLVAGAAAGPDLELGAVGGA